MNDKLKNIVREWVPSKFIRIVKKISGTGIKFKGDFQSWDDAISKCVGYDAEGILSKVLNATLKVKNNEAIYERDSVLFNKIHYSWPATAALMWAAARKTGYLNVLDFGGSLGSSYFQNKKFFQLMPELKWNIIEQEHFVRDGKAHIENEQLHFYKSIQECLIENSPNVVLVSSVLQYLPYPYEILDELLSLNIDTIILDRTSYIKSSDKSKIMIQCIPKSIYSASYPCHFFVEQELVKYIEKRGYQLIEEFDSLDDLNSFGYWKGHIYARCTT